MTVFCLRCWNEADSANQTCPHCGARLDVDERPYADKLVAALDHPLPEARARLSWLVGENGIEEAAGKLMSMVRKDPDLFVQRAAVEALGHLHAVNIRPFLEGLLRENNVWLTAVALQSLALQGQTEQNR